MSLNLFSLVVLLGAVQGLVLGLTLLCSRQENTLQKNALAFFMLILAYNGFETLNWSANINSTLFQFFPFTPIFGLGPCLYLYIHSFLSPAAPRRTRLFFLPVWIMFGFRMALWIDVFLFFSGHGLKVHPIVIDNWYGTIAEPLSVLYFCVFVYRALVTFRKFNVNTANIPQAEFAIVHKWLQAFLWCMLAMAVIWTLTYLAPFLFHIDYDKHYYPIEILLAFFIYWVAFAGYQRTRVVYIAQQKNTASFIDSVPAADIQACIAALKKAMETDRLYLDPDLSVQLLAEKIPFNTKTISAVLNQRLHKGFNEYINEYRVEEAKKRLLDPANRHLTISGIAFDCGFNSQATFQRAFKNSTGLSPKDFLQKSMQKQEN